MSKTFLEVALNGDRKHDAVPKRPDAIGQRLLELLPNARLHVTSGGNHDLARDHAEQLAPIVDAHLKRGGGAGR